LDCLWELFASYRAFLITLVFVVPLGELLELHDPKFLLFVIELEVVVKLCGRTIVGENEQHSLTDLVE